MKLRSIFFAIVLTPCSLVMADDQQDIAALRQASPWIPADATITKTPEGWQIVDNIKVAFVDDADVLGVWKTVDFVEDPILFTPNERLFQGNLFWKQVEFLPGGFQKSAFGTFINSSNKWTKGLFLATNPKEATASRYEIRDIKGQRYLFIEWRSGDYSIRAAKPWYYVFQR